MPVRVPDPGKRIVLVVQSDPAVAKRIKRGLEEDDSLTVHVARGGYEALWATVDGLPDLVLLDSKLPDLDGAEVCRILRSRERTAQTPIIVLSGQATAAARSVSFNAGADDCMMKPFTMEELHARVRSTLRRHPQSRRARRTAYQGKHIKAQFGDGFVAVDGRRVNLTRREFDLLWYLVEHRDQVISGERLLQSVWGGAHVGTDTRTVITHVARLRAKLGAAGNQIQTFFRKGYIFSEDSHASPPEHPE